MSHISFAYSFGSMPLRNPGGLPTYSKQKSVLVGRKVWVKARMSVWTARHTVEISTLKLLASSKLPQCFSKTILYYKACTFFFFSHFTLVLVALCWLSKVVLCVDANANPGRQANSTTVHCTERELRILSVDALPRCSSVWALLKYSVPPLHMGRLIWCLW